MTVEAWLAAAIADAERRGLTGLRPILETLARSTSVLREADRRAWEEREIAPRGDGGPSRDARRSQP